MLAIITVISGILMLVASIFGYNLKKTLDYVFWIVSSATFLIIGIALLAMGLDALSLPITIYLGCIYPSFLALGILYRRELYWKEFLGFIIASLVLVLIGDITNTILKTIAQVLLHTISGIIIVFIPLIFFIKKEAPPHCLLFTLGGITIGIGGLALASIAAGKAILPFSLVVLLLHPLLFLSGFLLAAGIYFAAKVD